MFGVGNQILLENDTLIPFGYNNNNNINKK